MVGTWIASLLLDVLLGAQKSEIFLLSQNGIQAHHHDGLAEISSNPPSNPKMINVEARNPSFRVGT